MFLLLLPNLKHEPLSIFVLVLQLFQDGPIQSDLLKRLLILGVIVDVHHTRVDEHPVSLLAFKDSLLSEQPAHLVCLPIQHLCSGD